MQGIGAWFPRGASHCFRQCCQSILLKADGRDSKEVGRITGLCAVSVNSWLQRSKAEGIPVCKPGRGRKALLSVKEDKEAILCAINLIANVCAQLKRNGKRKEVNR